MGKTLQIEDRTKRFAELHKKLSEEKKMVTHDELAKLFGLKRKQSITEMLGLRQNIQQDQWEAFKAHFGIKNEPNSTEISVPRETGGDLLMEHGNKIILVEAKSLSASYEKLIESNERFIAEKEARRQEAMALADKMEAHYKDAIAALERAQNTINEVLKPMAVSLKEIPPVLDLIVRNSNEHDKEIMKALDHLVGNKPGTIEKESGRRILKGALEHQKKGK